MFYLTSAIDANIVGLRVTLSPIYYTSCECKVEVKSIGNAVQLTGLIFWWMNKQNLKAGLDPKWYNLSTSRIKKINKIKVRDLYGIKFHIDALLVLLYSFCTWLWILYLSLSLSAISRDVGDHGMPQLSVSSFLNQLHFLMSYTPLCYPCI